MQRTVFGGRDNLNDGYIFIMLLFSIDPKFNVSQYLLLNIYMYLKNLTVAH